GHWFPDRLCPGPRIGLSLSPGSLLGLPHAFLLLALPSSPLLHDQAPGVLQLLIGQAVLRRALNDATTPQWGLLVRNPAQHASVPRARRRRRGTWSTNEAQWFLATIENDRLRALWVLALTTAARRGELIGLRWQDADLDAGRIAIRQTVIPDRQGRPM